MRRGFCIVAALVLSAAAAGAARAQATLATSLVPSFSSGPARCDAVNVGDEGDLDITITVFDAVSGEVVKTEECTSGSSNGSVASGKRCSADQLKPALTQFLWCKIEVNLPGNDSTAQNPSLAALAKRVRGAIMSGSSDSKTIVVLPAL